MPRTSAGLFERTFLALPVGARRQEVVLHGHEQRCRDCGRTVREPILFAHGKQRWLQVVTMFLVAPCQIAPIKHVAAFMGVGWDLVKTVFKAHLRRRLKKRSLRGVRIIPVLECSTRYQLV